MCLFICTMQELINDDDIKLEPIKERDDKKWYGMRTLIFLSLWMRMCLVLGYDDTAETDLWLLWCHVWESGRGNIGAIKRHGGPSPVADCFPPAKIHRMRVNVCLRVLTRPGVSLCVCVCLRPCVLWGRWQGPWPPHPGDRQWERSISSNIPWVTKTICPVKSG